MSDAAFIGRALGRSRRAALFAFLTTLALVAAHAPPLRAQTSDPLAHLVEEAIRHNLALEQARLSEDRAGAEAREARGLFLPALALESRYSEQDGTLNFGDFVNPAYAALNEMSGTNRFPTDLDFTLPFQHESRLRLTQPLFNERIRANYALARHRRDATSYERRA
ncbi:MAG: TolC family protein, partial [Gemmatimonadota bacterium]